MHTSTIRQGAFIEDDHPKYYDNENNIEPSKSVDVSFLAKLKNITSVSEILRLFGACAVIASMSLFLLNGWTEGNDIQRYLKLLTQTGLLTLAGFVMSYALKENKGARLFFALGLISVVANFTILGALTYSMIQLDGGLIEYPSMMTWSAVSAASFWPVFVAAVIALLVLARFSFSIFARNIATPLSLTFLFMNAFLLVPVRSSLLISILAVVSLWIASVVVKSLSQRENVVFTRETKFAFSLMFAPAMLMITRAVSLYRVDEIILVLLSGLAYMFVRFVSGKLNASSNWKALVSFMQFAIGIIFSLSVVILLPYSLSSIVTLVFAVAVMGVALDQIKRTSNMKWKQSILTVSTITVIGTTLFLSLIQDIFLEQVLSVLICAAVLYIANYTANAKQHNRVSKIVSLLGLLVSIGALLIELVQLMNLGNWMIIGIVGASLIVLGSLYERYGLALIPKLQSSS